jgi:hypothetical protein
MLYYLHRLLLYFTSNFGEIFHVYVIDCGHLILGEAHSWLRSFNLMAINAF